MQACVSPAISIVLPPSFDEGPMLRMQKSKSRTSLLAELIATDDESDKATNGGNSVGDAAGLLLPTNWRENNPKEVLQELLGDFFIDADDLVKKELIGEGGFAVVHRCSYLDSVNKQEIDVAMKELKPDLLENMEDLREFVMEASLQRKLHHSNIVKILGIGARDCTTMQTMRRSMFIIQEFVPGRNLKEMVIQQMCNRNAQIYTMKRAVGWLLDIACALHYLHDVCRPMIVHRDLKLDNILLNQSGKLAKLCDFGLHKRIRTYGISPANLDAMDDSYYGGMLYQSLMERVAEDGPSQESEERSLKNSVPYLRDLTLSTQLSLSSLRSSQSLKHATSLNTQVVAEGSYSDRPSREKKVGFTGKVGSIVYMAPEVFLNKPYDEKVDVFSFGVMMYELLAQTNLAVKYGMMEEHGALNGYAEKVANGFRETIPKHWPEYVKMLVTECWDDNPLNRPSFKDIVHRLTFIHDSGIAEKIGRPLVNMNLFPLKCCCIQ